jgi:hypothetical protein
LCVQDTTDLDYTHRTCVGGLGRIGDGGGRGFQQHSALAVDPQRNVLGLLHQAWFNRPEPPPGETRRQRQGRWTLSDVWADAAEAIGVWRSSRRLIHVGDRHSDVFGFLGTCRRLGHGYVVRAMHNRYVNDATDQLWPLVQRAPLATEIEASIGAQRPRRKAERRTGRTFRAAVRFCPVRFPAPRNDPRTASSGPVSLWAVYVRQIDSPPDEDAVEWLLLTSEPVETTEQALTIIQWYQHRWVIEECHRALKEGCRLEASQLDQAADLHRLAAIAGIVAVRLLQLRDLARDDSGTSDNPEVLRCTVPSTWIEVVSRLALKQANFDAPNGGLGGGCVGAKHAPRPRAA